MVTKTQVCPCLNLNSLAVSGDAVEQVGPAEHRVGGVEGAEAGAFVAEHVTPELLEDELRTGDGVSRPMMRAMAANLLKKPSSGPKISDGRRMTALGNASRTASSPCALVTA